MTIYLDNAATTPISEEVWKEMEPMLKENFGNPSSMHQIGRKVKNMIETSRKEISSCLGAQPGQIIFTGGGSEANNTIISSAIKLGVNHIITSPIEHHAIIHSVEAISKENNIKVSFVLLDNKGNVDLTSLDHILSENPEDKILVSLMHVNNEIGNILPIEKVIHLCKLHQALFHSDMVQSIGVLPINFENLDIDFASCSAHKFHGPKGIGFIYSKESKNISPLIHGGSQERGHRAGTENTAGIVGMKTALLSAYANLGKNYTHLQTIKSYFLNGLKSISNKAIIAGNEVENSSPKIANICLPPDQIDDMFLFNLDINGVAASGGSACSSGSNQGSHVINQLELPQGYRAFRFSFSKFNTIEEIDTALQVIKKIISKS